MSQTDKLEIENDYGYRPRSIPQALKLIHGTAGPQSEVTDMQPRIVEHGELKLIGIPCISLNDMRGKYQHAKEALLSSTKHFSVVKNPFVQYGIWPQVPSQQQSEMHAYILCVEVESFDGIPEWYFRTTMPPQINVVVSNKSGDFDLASRAIDHYIDDNRISVDAKDREYIICERYNYDEEGFSRYSLPIQSTEEGRIDGYKPDVVPRALKVIGVFDVNSIQEESAVTEQKQKMSTYHDSLQVRVVTDLEKSLAWYRDVLGCEVDYWGHAIRGGMKLILQQAKQPSDVMPNQVSAKRDNYPTDWTGPDLAWDTFVHVNYEEFDPLLEELRANGANIIYGPVESTHSNGMTFKNVYIEDPDGYVIVFG